jgi:hypothetical protein
MAGRSTTDVKAVARAQGELKQRAERLSGPMRQHRRPGGGSDAAGTADDPLLRAVEAMGRAQSSLDAIKTREAVPSEMEALNHLLRARAEIKRREVTRQQANGAGGGFNRAQEDLSSLFDRELQRQQQTNYETPRTQSDDQNGRGNDALDKVRDLARRQEQLARQQEDLARTRDTLAPEDVKRRLESLTREQTELRRQAEQLGQQMATQREQSGQPGSSGQSGQAASSTLRDASEQMQGAASDLRREDPSRASARSARALDSLRALERQLQGDQPGERRRALGDLQLEARQLADRQRQLGEQAAGANRGAADDARRRAAGEQDRLAERADRLQSQIGELAGGAKNGAERSAIGEAQRSLRDARVGERMRQLARGWRGQSPDGATTAKPPAGAAGPSDQTAGELARALDRAADRLADVTAGGDADARRLSDQLSRARDVRQRLDDLRRRMAELQRRPDDKGSGSPGAAADGQAPGASGRAGDTGGPSSRRELERLEKEYGDQLREAARLQQELSARGPIPGTGGAGSTPVGQAMVYSAPGTEAFKQDFSKWDVLHKDVTLGLERLEASLSQKLLERALKDRLSGGAADAAPDAYRRAVEQYFRSLASSRP